MTGRVCTGVYLCVPLSGCACPCVCVPVCVRVHLCVMELAGGSGHSQAGGSELVMLLVCISP